MTGGSLQAVCVISLCEKSDEPWGFAEGRSLAAQYGFRFLETSAKDRINVDETFVEVVREIRRHNVSSSPPIFQSLFFYLSFSKELRKGSLVSPGFKVGHQPTSNRAINMDHDACCGRCIVV
jgi:hypothetical protein